LAKLLVCLGTSVSGIKANLEMLNKRMRDWSEGDWANLFLALTPRKGLNTFFGLSCHPLEVWLRTSRPVPHLLPLLGRGTKEFTGEYILPSAIDLVDIKLLTQTRDELVSRIFESGEHAKSLLDINDAGFHPIWYSPLRSLLQKVRIQHPQRGVVPSNNHLTYLPSLEKFIQVGTRTELFKALQDQYAEAIVPSPEQILVTEGQDMTLRVQAFNLMNSIFGLLDARKSCARPVNLAGLDLLQSSTRADEGMSKVLTHPDGSQLFSPEENMTWQAQLQHQYTTLANLIMNRNL
jgi:hypothetical protein